MNDRHELHQVKSTDGIERKNVRMTTRQRSRIDRQIMQQSVALDRSLFANPGVHRSCSGNCIVQVHRIGSIATFRTVSKRGEIDVDSRVRSTSPKDICLLDLPIGLSKPKIAYHGLIELMQNPHVAPCGSLMTRSNRKGEVPLNAFNQCDTFVITMIRNLVQSLFTAVDKPNRNQFG